MFRRMNWTGGNGRATQNVAIVAAGLGLWGGLAMLFAAPLALTGSAPWREAVRFGVSFWALWLLFLPAVAWLAFRFPIERRRLLRNVALHLLACLLIAGANRAASRVAERVLPRLERSAPTGPPNAFGAFFSFRAALDVLVYWSLVGACQAVTNFQSSRERERRAAELEALLAGAKLQTLRMQVNPHFLFNTLNSIAALVYVNPRAADEMLGDLGALLRRSLDSMGEQEVPLGQELDFAEAYVRIEQRRFGERLRLEWSAPDDLMKALVPALILQPLVENAVRHGIEPRRGPGLISIEAAREGGHLRLAVRDDGRGLREADSASSARRGVGLANTEARLRGLYGADQRFSFGAAEPQGFQVEIRLPLHFEPARVPANLNGPAA